MLCCQDKVQSVGWDGVGVPREPDPSRNTTVGTQVLQMMWRHKQDFQVENGKVLREMLLRCRDSRDQAAASSVLWMSRMSIHPGQRQALQRCHLGLVSRTSAMLCLSGQNKPLSRTE